MESFNCFRQRQSDVNLRKVLVDYRRVGSSEEEEKRMEQGAMPLSENKSSQGRMKESWLLSLDFVCLWSSWFSPPFKHLHLVFVAQMHSWCMFWACPNKHVRQSVCVYCPRSMNCWWRYFNISLMVSISVSINSVLFPINSVLFLQQH